MRCDESSSSLDLRHGVLLSHILPGTFASSLSVPGSGGTDKFGLLHCATPGVASLDGVLGMSSEYPCTGEPKVRCAVKGDFISELLSYFQNNVSHFNTFQLFVVAFVLPDVFILFSFRNITSALKKQGIN